MSKIYKITSKKNAKKKTCITVNKLCMLPSSWNHFSLKLSQKQICFWIELLKNLPFLFWLVRSKKFLAFFPVYVFVQYLVKLTFYSPNFSTELIWNYIYTQIKYSCQFAEFECYKKKLSIQFYKFLLNFKKSLKYIHEYL